VTDNERATQHKKDTDEARNTVTMDDEDFSFFTLFLHGVAMELEQMELQVLS
jgi:hypothetical protein